MSVMAAPHAIPGRARQERIVDLRYRAALGNNPAEVAPVRRAVSRVASMVGFLSRADDVELAMGEVLANAQEHGRAPITVSAWFDGRFLIEVRDHGRGFDRTRVWASHPPTPLGLRGRGLWIARQITDGVTVSSSGEGTTVTIEFCREPQLGA